MTDPKTFLKRLRRQHILILRAEPTYTGHFWAVFGHFLKNFDKKIAGARSPSKLVYIGAEGAFRKILGSVGQKWISEKVSKGGPFGSAGGRIPEGGGGRPPNAPPPPLNPPL